MNSSLLLRILILISALLVSGAGSPAALASPGAFNELLEEKALLQKKYGVETLECFPFIKNIGFTEDQGPLIEHCLAGARTLGRALAKIPGAEYRIIGLSTQFLRTGGFHTVLVPWDASEEKMIRFLSLNLSQEERERFLDKIYSLKRTILKKIPVNQLYCTMEISNKQCLLGYQNLSGAASQAGSLKIKWRNILVTRRHVRQQDPYSLALGFDQSPPEMLKVLKKGPDKQWSVRKQVYDNIRTQYGQAFKERLQLENFFCAPDLSEEECETGASHLFEASENDSLQEKFWGKVIFDRFNTIIHDDFNVSIRYDLPAREIVRRLSAKPTRQEATRNSLMAEKLERRSKNNHAHLRGVCDLDGLRSALCAKAFQNFITFLENNRDYRVARPWTDLMFVDGMQLSRVNFALNSSSRKTYIYIDANSSQKQFEEYLKKFAGRGPD
ncbi:MAG: hypothetical protein ACE5E9_12810 [Nitrospinaceae bacterium]